MIDALILSRNRPYQLDALFYSFFYFCEDPYNVRFTVLYNATNELFQRGYNSVFADWSPQAIPDSPRGFEEDVKRIIMNFKSEFVMFLVDDTLFYTPFALSPVLLEMRRRAEEVMGLSLRLGANTTQCYSQAGYQGVPAFEPVHRLPVFAWQWLHPSGEAPYDWGYPMEVSSSVYAASDILSMLPDLHFGNPNMMETILWANRARFSRGRTKMFCYQNSVAFSNPVNRVQNNVHNRSGVRVAHNEMELLGAYAAGKRFSVKQLAGVVPDAAHYETPLL